MDKKITHAIFFTPPLSQLYLGHQIKEIYFDNVYSNFLQGKENLTILDLGANVGMTSYYFSQFADTVYAVEPATEHFEDLTRMIEFNKIKNIKAINKAIYIKSGKFPLFKNKNRTMFSLHAAVHDNSSKSEDVDTITIKDLFETHKIKHVDLMKLDIEGSEYEVLSHTSFIEVAPRINTVVVERHQWSGRNPNQLKEALKNVGYNVSQISGDADLLVGQR